VNTVLESVPVADESLGGTNDILSFSCWQKPGMQGVQWKRPLISMDKFDNVFNLSTPVNIIYAHGSPGMGWPTYHGSKNRCLGVWNVTSGDFRRNDFFCGLF
jgi:hypothetical protein